MQKIVSLTVLAATLGVAGAAKAAGALYDSTGNPRFNAPSDTTPLRYNNNSFGDTTRILYDDVPVATTGGPSSVIVSSVRFDIVQKAGAPAVDVSGFWSPMEPEAAHDGGAVDGPGLKIDGPNDDPNSANSLGAPVPLLANTTPNDRVVSVFFTNPFNTGPLNTTQDPGGFSFFNVGLSFSNTNGFNGWEVADHPNNLDVLWDFKNPTDTQEFTFGNDANGDPVIGTMAAQIVGTVVPVPEPGVISLMLGGCGMLLGRRRQRGN